MQCGESMIKSESLHIAWLCDGTAQDMVAVMMSGEEGANKQRQIKEVVFLAQQKGKGGSA